MALEPNFDRDTLTQQLAQHVDNPTDEYAETFADHAAKHTGAADKYQAAGALIDLQERHPDKVGDISNATAEDYALELSALYDGHKDEFEDLLSQRGLI